MKIARLKLDQPAADLLREYGFAIDEAGEIATLTDTMTVEIYQPKFNDGRGIRVTLPDGNLLGGTLLPLLSDDLSDAEDEPA